MKRWVAVAALVTLCAAVPSRATPRLATGSFQVANLAYLPGSTIPLRVNGFDGRLRYFVSGDGKIDGDRYEVGEGSNDTIVAASAHGLAMHAFAVAPAPDPRNPFIAVASYDDGVILHDVNAPYHSFAALGIGGAPGDVAIDGQGRLASAATDGTTATIASLDPWNVQRYERVPFVDELAFDSRDGSLFLTNRDVAGAGALTRITTGGAVTTRVLGLTAEGLAIDSARNRVYVANVNDGTVSVVDTRTMVEVRRLRAIDRVFSLALSNDGARLFAVSNQSLDSPFNAAGGVVTIDVRAPHPRVIARSARLTFPVGIAYDALHNRLYVTDEETDSVDVLDARTLRATRAPLRTCRTPWKPTIDRGLLMIPCANSDQVDAFDTATLKRIPGAPFATGGYPLAVAVWHGRPAATP